MKKNKAFSFEYNIAQGSDQSEGKKPTHGVSSVLIGLEEPEYITVMYTLMEASSLFERKTMLL